MKKNHVRISVDISKELNEKLRKATVKKDMTMNTIVRLAIESYLVDIS